MPRLLLQLTDLHVRVPGALVNGRVDTNALLVQAIRSVNRLPQAPDAAVVTGDLTDLAHPDEYRHLRTLLEPLRCPIYLLPGNHDDRAALRAAFPDHACLQGKEDFIQYAVDLGGLRLVGLDSSVYGQPHGALCATRLAWLARTLADAPTLPTLIAIHHPPFATGIGHMDEMGLREGGEEFERIVAAAPQVERVICGHLHRSIQRRWGGTIAMTAPSTAHQLALNLSADAIGAYTFEPPGYLLHVWSPALGVVTHLATTAPCEGPYSFADGSLVPSGDGRPA
ncbi:MAG: phosphodiesterase [Proteobacteria bacterium]|nr:phosphodiesterase [Pseudomonadota bacterium]